MIKIKGYLKNKLWASKEKGSNADKLKHSKAIEKIVFQSSSKLFINSVKFCWVFDDVFALISGNSLTPNLNYNGEDIKTWMRL